MQVAVATGGIQTRPEADAAAHSSPSRAPSGGVAAVGPGEGPAQEQSEFHCLSVWTEVSEPDDQDPLSVCG